MVGTYEKRLYCRNCKTSWMQSIPVGYLAEVEERTGRAQIRKEKGTDIKKDFICPKCGTQSEIEWD